MPVGLKHKSCVRAAQAACDRQRQQNPIIM
jgi:hypothetical protein